MSVGCPCGSEKQSGVDNLAFITNDLLQAALTSVPVIGQWLEMVYPLIGQMLDVQLICTMPPPVPPEFDLLTWLNPLQQQDALTQAIASVQWQSWCQCVTCPPITGCDGDPGFVVVQGDGQLNPDGDPEPNYIYTLPSGEYFVKIGPSACYSKAPGLQVIFWPAGPAIPHGLIQMCYGDGSTCTNADPTIYGNTVSVWVNGAPDPPSYNWPATPEGLPSYPDPPTCDATSVCTALSPVYDQLQQIQFVADLLNRQVVGVAGATTFDLPGVAEIVGTLVNALPRALAALAPPTADQLVLLDSSNLTGQGEISVAGIPVVTVALTTIPDYLGTWGRNAPVYFSKATSPGPGWLSVESSLGVLKRLPVQNADGEDIDIPARATVIKYDLLDGVEITLSRYNRVIS